MAHQSPGDPNMHYSVQGESSDDVKVKGGHIPLDSSKQTVIISPLSPVETNKHTAYLTP